MRGADPEGVSGRATRSRPPGDVASGDLQVVARVARVLRLLSEAQRPLRLATAAEDLGLSRSTTHRYLASLENHGFLARVRGLGYEAGPLLVQLGTFAVGRLRVVEVAQPLMAQLSNEARQTSVLSVWGGVGAVVARVHEDRSRTIHVSVGLGSTLPPKAAQSQVFLAHMSDQRAVQQMCAALSTADRRALVRRLGQVRSTGLAVEEMVVEGVRTIAVPIFDVDGEICAALALIGTSKQIPVEVDSDMAEAVVRAGRRLTEAVAWVSAPLAERDQELPESAAL